MDVPIYAGFYEDAVRPISSQECVNWQPQIPQTEGVSPGQLVQSAGISEFANTGNYSARGRHEMNGIVYTVNGSTLNRINSNGSFDALGMITGSGNVSIADNGVQICIVVPGSTGYVYSVAGGLVEITDPDFTTTLGPSQQVVYHDGYFVHFNNESAASTQAIFFVSNLKDGLTYDALDYGTAEVDPDNINGLHVNRNRLYVGGQITLEPFQNIGGADFPYQRVPGGVVQKGIRAKFSAKDFDNSFVFVGGGENEKASIWRYEGSGASKISTSAIDNVLQGLTDAELNNVTASVYAENGAYIYYVHLNDRTFGYDAATQKWHERKSKNEFGQVVNWRVNGIIEAYGRILVTDNQSGKIGEIDKDVYTEYGETKYYSFSTKPFSNDGETVSISTVELDCESGTAGPVAVGLSRYDAEDYSEAGYDIPAFLIDPFEYTVQMEISDDGGYLFGYQIPRGLGLQGEYKKRQVWGRQGQFDDTRVYRFVHDGDIKMSIMRMIIK